MRLQHQAPAGSFLVAAGAHYLRTMPRANHSLSSPVLGGAVGTGGQLLPRLEGSGGAGVGAKLRRVRPGPTPLS